MDKENVVYILNGILFSLKNEGNRVICYNVDGARGLYANRNKPELERQILHDLCSMWNFKSQTYKSREK
jgi:hypothetical protein